MRAPRRVIRAHRHACSADRYACSARIDTHTLRASARLYGASYGAQLARPATCTRRVYRRVLGASRGAQPARLRGVRSVCILNRSFLILVLLLWYFSCWATFVLNHTGQPGAARGDGWSRSYQPETLAATLKSRVGSANSPCASRYNDTLQGIENTTPERSPEARTKEILFKPMEEQSPRLTTGWQPVHPRFIRGLSPGREALFLPGCWPLSRRFFVPVTYFDARHVWESKNPDLRRSEPKIEQIMIYRVQNPNIPRAG